MKNIELFALLARSTVCSFEFIAVKAVSPTALVFKLFQGLFYSAEEKRLLQTTRAMTLVCRQTGSEYSLSLCVFMSRLMNSTGSLANNNGQQRLYFVNLPRLNPMLFTNVLPCYPSV